MADVAPNAGGAAPPAPTEAAPVPGAVKCAKLVRAIWRDYGTLAEEFQDELERVRRAAGEVGEFGEHHMDEFGEPTPWRLGCVTMDGNEEPGEVLTGDEEPGEVLTFTDYLGREIQMTKGQWQHLPLVETNDERILGIVAHGSKGGKYTLSVPVGDMADVPVPAAHLEHLSGSVSRARSVMETAAKDDDVAGVRAMLGNVGFMEKVVNDDGPCNDSISNALSAAAGDGHLSTVELLVPLVVDRHERYEALFLERWGRLFNHNNNGISNALCAAAGGGHLSTVELLVPLVVDRHQRYVAFLLKRWGPLFSLLEPLCDPLVRASEWGHLAVVEMLVASGADVTEDHSLAAWIAYSRGHIAVLEFLESRGAVRNPAVRHSCNAEPVTLFILHVRGVLLVGLMLNKPIFDYPEAYLETSVLSFTIQFVYTPATFYRVVVYGF